MSKTCCAPPPLPQDRVKLFASPLLKSGNVSCPPYNMAKTSSYRVKTTPKLVVPPPSAWIKPFLPPPPLFVGVKPHMPPPLPVISDQSLTALVSDYQPHGPCHKVPLVEPPLCFLISITHTQVEDQLNIAEPRLYKKFKKNLKKSSI